MAQSAASGIANLILRAITLLLLLISLIVLITASKTIQFVDGSESKFKFNEVWAYRYMLASIVFGTAYTFLQLAFSINNLVSKSEGNPLFDFYGDKIMSYILATGSAAGFGVTKDMKRILEVSGLDLGQPFYDKAWTTCSLLLFAFVCTAISSVISSYALPKRVSNQ